MKRGLAWAALLAVGCGTTYRSDLGALKARTETLVLGDRERDARVLVCPELGGRVMSSGATGEGGKSYGWFDAEAIGAEGPGMSARPIGGEDRVVLPAGAAEGPYELLSSESEIVKMRKDARPREAAGVPADLRLEREVRVLREERAWRLMQMAPEPEIRMVAYETINHVRNVGIEPWTSERGIVARIVGAFPADPGAVVVLPLRDGPGSALLEQPPPDRLYARPGLVFFRADGLRRCRVSIRPERIRPILGCWSPERGVLTLIQHTAWKVSARNDGPSEPEELPAGFFEIELASAPLVLAPGKMATITRRTIHAQGPRAGLDALARRQLGASLDEIEAAPLR